MNLSPPNRPELPAGLLADSLPISEILYEAEAPIVYVTETQQGEQLLAYLADESRAAAVTFLAPTSPERIEALEQGALTVRDALQSSWLWMHLFDGRRGKAWAIEASEIPDLFFPERGTILPGAPRHTQPTSQQSRQA
ncbi:MAG TPA: hypothetical protein VF584_03635 [Longimicrobium sp.]|jgi:hypothetical protein